MSDHRSLALLAAGFLATMSGPIVPAFAGSTNGAEGQMPAFYEGRSSPGT
jgi:hypothetical protein